MVSAIDVQHDIVHLHELCTTHYCHVYTLSVAHHLEEYAKLGHPYLQDYMLTADLSWVLCMSPLMMKLLSQAEFIEADVTYQASIEFSYLFNVVTFNYTTLKCN